MGTQEFKRIVPLFFVAFLSACDGSHNSETTGKCEQYLESLELAVNKISQEVEKSPPCLDCLSKAESQINGTEDPRNLARQIKNCTLDLAYNLDADFYMAQVEVGVLQLYSEIERQQKRTEGDRSFDRLRQITINLESAVVAMNGEVN